MAEQISYAILGRGRWAARILAILNAESRRTRVVDDVRRRAFESDGDYKTRLTAALRAAGAQIAWFCVPPGPHIYPLAEAALAAGLHIVLEKPWFCSREESAALSALSQARHLRIAMHYQYCLLQAVTEWRRELDEGTDLCFGGSFCTSHPNRLAISAIDNLGSHLLAIRAHAVPRSAISEIHCAYERPDERRVRVEKKDGQQLSIDFFKNEEPIIQRFAKLFETALGGAAFPFDLDFAQRIADQVSALKHPAAPEFR